MLETHSARWAFLLLAGSLVAPLAARAARPAGEAEAEEAGDAPGVERDDPRARAAANREWRGVQGAERVRILEEARRERDRYGVPGAAGGAGSRNALTSAVQGSVFINLGPSRADFEKNDVTYNEMDSGRARQILTHPVNPNILYMATSGGGVWKSFDAGAGWEPITDALGTTTIGTLAMDPSSPEILFLGFGDPFDVQQPGLVKSLDGGASWSDPKFLTATYSSGGKAYSFVADSVRDLKIDPRNSLVVLVATNHGFFRSTDGGTSFSHLPLVGGTPADTYYEFWSIAYAGPDTWLLSGQRKDITGAAPAGELGFWRSTDDGATWIWQGAALGIGIGRVTLSTSLSTASDAKTARVYVLAGDTAGNSQKDVFRTDDGGQTFASLRVNASRAPTNPNFDQSDLNVMHGQAFYNQALLADPLDPDLVFIGGNLAMVRSSDGGKSWSVLSDWLPTGNVPIINRPYVHADFHTFAVASDGTFYAGSDGGLFQSASARLGAVSSVNFTSSRNEGLVTHLIYSVACAQDNWPAALQGFVAGGLQDNGTRARSGSSTTFNQVVGGDGIGLAVSGGTTMTPSGASVPSTFLASVEFGIYRSLDGGATFQKFDANFGLAAALPFFVRIARDDAPDPVAVPNGDAFLTFTTPAAVYRSAAGSGWVDVSGSLHWKDSGQTTSGFTTVSGGAIGLRNLAASGKKPGVWGAVSNKFVYLTANSGRDWDVSLQPRPQGQTAAVYLLSSVALDPTDLTGHTAYVTSKSMNLVADDLTVVDVPAGFPHLYKTTDGGSTWTGLGGQAVSAGGLPVVPFDVVKVDPNDAKTIYVGTELGLYRSADGGANWARYGGGSLPLVEVTDFCISEQSKRLTVSTFGRGFWQISTDPSANPAGVRGRGDTNYDLRIDGLDLIDFADAFGSTQASPTYRYQADLKGTTNAIDDDDLTEVLKKFGGQP